MRTISQQYWLNRWDNNEIGFHLTFVSEQFSSFAKDILKTLPKPARVFFPLCGKSLDMVETLKMGHQVIGIEISEKAIKEFAVENHISLEKCVEVYGQVSFQGNNITIYCQDLFDIIIEPHVVDFIFDRAALVAIDPAYRLKYTKILSSLLKPNGQMMLVSLYYNKAQMDGPPYSIPEEEISALFMSSFSIKKLHSEEVIHRNENLKSKGLDSLISSTYLMTKI